MRITDLKGGGHDDEKILRIQHVAVRRLLSQTEIEHVFSVQRRDGRRCFFVLCFDTDRRDR